MSSYHHLFWLQLLLLHSLCFANLSSHHQSSALLHFKQLFTIDETGYHFYDCHKNGQPLYPKMKNWDVETDCCLWDGVTCDFVTGHIIGLDLSCSQLYGIIPSNTTLSLFPHLQNLNLAFNDFNHSQIPTDFFRLTSLIHLNLSSSIFSGQIPSEISHLNNLISLDLSDYSYDDTDSALETLVMEGLVQNMTKLEQLRLNGVNMSRVVPTSLTNLSSSLTFLSLIQCELQGSFPESIFHLPNLHTLDLSGNYQLTWTFPKFNWSSPLRYLDVSYTTTFLSEIPHSIGNLKSLTHLDMISCNLTGSIPASIGNLTQLSGLALSYNNLQGYIPSFLSNLHQLTSLSLSRSNLSGEIPNIFTNLTQLYFLDLSHNSLSGPIPPTLGGIPNLATINLGDNSLFGTIPSKLLSLPSLEYIDLYSNRLFGQIHEFQSNSLQSIDLSYNRLHGPIPRSIFEQVNLTNLDLSSNNLSGTIELHMFAKLKNLQGLYLSYNSLSLSTTIEANSSFPQLDRLGLSSCNINEFPKITADSLGSLDLSDNKIHGQIPNWLFNITALSQLNLSHNFLTGIEWFPWMGMRYLDLHSNLLQGQLPAPPPSLNFFSVSHNNLTGVLPSSFCNLGSIQYLELSNNSLSGKIPQCVGDSTTTLVLDLRMNNFHGRIPQTFANGSQLTTLNLNGNRLEGSLPHSLINCGNLEVLDLGNNMINDTFPHWLATLPELQVLILRSNRFYGPIGNSTTRLPFSKLRILDISHNGFMGYLQTSFFETFQAMMSGKNSSAGLRYVGVDLYKDTVMVTMKGVDIEMQRILTIFNAMDLSSNKFQGRIPKLVGNLNSLIVLNFSHNSLTGSIPVSLENLTEIESLDLSSNMLEGEIPMQLTSLTYLSALNLSYNKLAGPIPHGKQFNTFQNNCYVGNYGLCGFPLSTTCSNDEAPESKPTIIHDEQNSSSWFDWKFIMMGYGSGLVIGLSMAYIVFSTGQPWWFVRKIERKAIKLSERRRRRRRN